MKGMPYECIFGPKKIWTKTWRNAAVMVLNDMAGGEEELDG
jgi:hypothetical protein